MANNQLCGLYPCWYDADMLGIYTTEGITKLCEGLKGSAVTLLRFAAAPQVFAFMSAPVDTLHPVLAAWAPTRSVASTVLMMVVMMVIPLVRTPRKASLRSAMGSRGAPSPR